MLAVRCPDWLCPITPATIGILALVVLFVVKVVHEVFVHRAEDRRDEERDER